MAALPHSTGQSKCFRVRGTGGGAPRRTFATASVCPPVGSHTSPHPRRTLARWTKYLPIHPSRGHVATLPSSTMRGCAMFTMLTCRRRGSTHPRVKSVDLSDASPPTYACVSLQAHGPRSPPSPSHRGWPTAAAPEGARQGTGRQKRSRWQLHGVRTNGELYKTTVASGVDRS